MKIKLNKKIVFLIVGILIVVCILNIPNAYYIIQTKIYPRKYDAEVSKYAEEFDVDKYLIFAIIKAESNFKKDAISNKNAMGLMQLMPDTATDIAKIINIELNNDLIMDTDVNIKLGTKYISILINKYQNIEIALCAYNAGSGNVDNWISKGIINTDGTNIEEVPFKETNNYVRKILRDYKTYKQLYE